MLKTFRIISALIIIVLALSVIFTNALVTMPYMLIALSVMTFIMSAEEKQKQKKYIVHSPSFWRIHFNRCYYNFCLSITIFLLGGSNAYKKITANHRFYYFDPMFIQHIYNELSNLFTYHFVPL